MQPCSDISPSTRNLMTYVAACQSRTLRQAEATRRATMRSAAASASDGGEGGEGGGGVFASALRGQAHKCVQHGLTPFLAGELSKIVKKERKVRVCLYMPDITYFLLF